MAAKHVHGFTLIELLIVVAILAVLLMVAVPNFGGFLAQGRIDGAKNKLISSISFTRSEAIKRSSRVSICRSNTAATNCAGTSTGAGTANWSQGWLVFVDIDEDSNIDSGELLRVETDSEPQVTVQYSRGDIIIYDGQGMLTTASTGDETFIISDSVDSSVELGLSVRSTGRIRSCIDWNVSGHTCNDS